MKLVRHYQCGLCKRITRIWVVRFRRGPLCRHRRSPWSFYGPVVTHEVDP